MEGREFDFRRAHHSISLTFYLRGRIFCGICLLSDFPHGQVRFGYRFYRQILSSYFPCVLRVLGKIGEYIKALVMSVVEVAFKGLNLEQSENILRKFFCVYPDQ